MSSGSPLKTLKYLTGTFLGAGLLPKAPGTWGSLLFLPVIYVVAYYGSYPGMFALLICTIILSLWSTHENVERFGDDPPEFVMDECAGQTIPFLTIPFHFQFYPDIAIILTGFIFFRFFDIAKPLGINRLQKLDGKYGILFDDILAGIYALICLEGLLFLISNLI